MLWALISTIEQPLSYWSWDENGEPVYIETIAVPGTIVNIISYDGISPYTPPDGTSLQQVPDTAKIGDTGY